MYITSSRPKDYTNTLSTTVAVLKMLWPMQIGLWSEKQKTGLVNQQVIKRRMNAV